MQAMPVPGVKAQLVYNSLDSKFLSKASTTAYTCRHEGRFNVLMISSLRDYKGVPELLDVAAQLLDRDELYFDLVVNDDPVTINSYFTDKTIPANITIHPKTNDTTVFYKKASLVLNLSRMDRCVETFGLTILEAMSFGIPVIAPPVGGPTELVDDGVTGYLIDSCNTEELICKITELVNNDELCLRFSKSAREKAKLFSLKKFEENILDAVNSITNSKISS